MKSLGIVAVIVLCTVFAAAMVIRMAPVNGGTATAANGGLEWHVYDDRGPLGEAPKISATATHYIDGGGSVAVEATCDDHTLSLEFEYHAKEDDAHSSFELQGTGGFVHTRYRADNGDIHEFVSQDDHPNVARVAFTYEMPGADGNGDAQQQGVLIGALATALIPGLAPQDLRAFLHALEDRFELPLANGSKEVIAVDPATSSFKGLLQLCKIDLRKFDEDAAKAKTKAQSNANDQPEASAPPSRQETAADTDARAAAQSAVYGDCALGDRTLVVGRATPLGSKSHGESQSGPIIPAGVEVTTIHNDDAPISGRCEIEYKDGDNKIHGFVPMASLARSSAPTAAPQN